MRSTPTILVSLLLAPLLALCTPPSAPYLHPTVQSFVDAQAAGTPLYELPIPEARAFLENAQVPGSPPLSSINCTTFNITVPRTKPGRISIHLFKPLNTTSKELPTIVYFHGGGWILGNANTHRRLMVDLAEQTGYAVWFVQYTPSPESQFPQPIDEAYAGLQHFIKHGGKYGLSTERFALAGDSAGGAMAAAVTLKSIWNHTPLPKLNVLFYPVTDVSKESDTYKTFFNGPGLAVKTLRWMIPAFVPRYKDRFNPLASPLLTSDEDLAKFPETLTLTAEVDPLRWEGEKFAERLSRVGVKSGVVRVVQTVHDFVLLNDLRQCAPTVVGIELAVGALRRVLG